MFVVNRILISSDHAGVGLRRVLSSYIESLGCTVIDCGCEATSAEAVDYPDYVPNVVDGVSESSFGVLICGTGIGMSIAANRNRNIRAALCFNTSFAKLAREHNNANVLCFGSRYIDPETAKKVTYEFITTKFLGGRHALRVKKLG